MKRRIPAVIVASEDGLMSSALSSILSRAFGGPVERAASLESATAVCVKHQAESDALPVIVFDLAQTEAPDGEGVAVLKAANEVARVIVIAPAEPFDRVLTLLELGVHGIIGRDADPEELVRAVVDAAGGNVVASRRVLRQLVDHVVSCPNRVVFADPCEVESLAPREREIVQLLTRGMTNREIAADLHVSEATVKAHLSRVMTRWQVRDRLQVVLCALGRFPVAG